MTEGTTGRQGVGRRGRDAEAWLPALTTLVTCLIGCTGRAPTVFEPMGAAPSGDAGEPRAEEGADGAASPAVLPASVGPCTGGDLELRKRFFVLKSSCAAGDVESCLAVAELANAVGRPWETLRALQRAADAGFVPAWARLVADRLRNGDVAGALDASAAGCAAGDENLCEEFLARLPDDRLTAVPRAWRGALTLLAARGFAVASRALGLVEWEEYARLADAETDFRAACDGGDAAGCTRLAELLVWIEPPREEEGALAAERACDAGDEPGCEVLAGIDRRGQVREEAAAGESAARTACELSEYDPEDEEYDPEDEEEDPAGGRCDGRSGSCDALGTVLLAGGDAAGAELVWRKACFASQADACVDLAGLLDETGRSAEAEAILRVPCENELGLLDDLQPAACRALYDRLQREGRDDEALDVLRLGCDAAESDGLDCIELEAELRRQGREEEAVDAAEQGWTAPGDDCSSTGKGCGEYLERYRRFDLLDSALLLMRVRCERRLDCRACARRGRLLEQLGRAEGAEGCFRVSCGQGCAVDGECNGGP